MVKLTVTVAAKAAIEEYCRISWESASEEDDEQLHRLSVLDQGEPIDHHDLIRISQFLVQDYRDGDEDLSARPWRLEMLLKGANIHRPTPPPKPEPVRCVLLDALYMY